MSQVSKTRIVPLSLADLGLHYSDCSIIPILISGHTQAPAYGIGEKAARLIAEDHHPRRQTRL